jgi:hypothetical protein
VKRNRAIFAFLAVSAVLVCGASTLLPARIREVSRLVEDVRGRRFESPVPASEIDSTALRKFLKAKLADSFPAPPEETLSSLVVLGLIDRTPDLLERLLDFYTSQVIAFYDPEPHRFFVVRGGARDALEGMGGGDLSERLLFSHELTHALQDQALRLDRRFKNLRDDGDRALALQCLLEGEATLVMVRVALKDLPGADTAAEEALAPLLSAGALEQANAPKDLPPYFVKQLFFPYVEGSAYVRRAVARGGWKEVDRPPRRARGGSAPNGSVASRSPPRPLPLFGHGRRVGDPLSPRAQPARGGGVGGRGGMAGRSPRFLRCRQRLLVPLANSLRVGGRGRAIRRSVRKDPGETSQSAPGLANWHRRRRVPRVRGGAGVAGTAGRQPPCAARVTRGISTNI